MANSVARLAALALLAIPMCAQVRRLPPVDESSRDSSLQAYLARFKAAVTQRDRFALVPLIDPNIQLSFGSDSGVENFRPDWPLLDRLLALGGAWEEDVFSVPYVFARFPRDLEPFDHGVVTGQGVWLRERPAGDGRGIRKLTYEIVRVVEEPGEAWAKVQTLSGESGYVAARYLARPLGYRAIFQKSAPGEWKMTAFLAGD